MILILSVLAVGCSSDNGQPAKKSHLILGDSISMQYGAYLNNDQYEIQRAKNYNKSNAQNCRYTEFGVEHIDRWLDQNGVGFKWNLITFNWGLHDLQRYSIEEYKSNLRILVAKIKARSNRAIFITTSAVVDGHTIRTDADSVLYNEAALEVMEETNTEVFDMYAVSSTIKHEIYDDVHYTENGAKILADALKEYILKGQ